MDPITLMATASAAFKGVKALVDSGGEIENVFQQLNKWAGYVSDVKEWCAMEESKPSIFSSLKSSKSSTAEAMNTVVARQQVLQQETQIREMLSWYAPSGMYEEFLKERADIDKRRERRARDIMQRRRNFVKNTFYSVTISVCLATLMWIGYIVYEASNRG